MSNNNLYDKKFYEENKKAVNSANIILPFIINKLNPKNIVDFGCGSGAWLFVAQKNGVEDILGIDGNYVDTDWLLIDNNDFLADDITKKIKLTKKYDLAISLEVGEHIEKSKINNYILNLTNSSDVILFSAAIPNQGGTEHINEQYLTYWVEKFKEQNFELCDVLRSKFWNNETIDFWYKQNIVFFVKKDCVEKINAMFTFNSIPNNVVHPILLENVIKELKNVKEENFKLKQEHSIKKEIINKKPKVTIIVPVFNVVKYLKECLDSILNQTLEDIEVICGDGGSNDGSLEILEQYAKKDVRLKYISKEKSGYGQSVNECMDMAKGEYIGIVESDDKVDPRMYENLYYVAKKNNLDWIRSDIYFYYSEKPEPEQLKRELITYGNNIYNMVIDPSKDYRPYKTALRTWSGIYKTEFLNSFHIRHHETPGGSYQDVGFYLKTLYYAKRVYFLDKAFYMWRQDNPGSSIHYDSKKLVEKSLHEWDLNKQYLINCADTTDRMWGSFNYRRFFSYLWTIEMITDDKKYKKEITNKLKKELKTDKKNGHVVRAFFNDNEWKQFKHFIR